MMPDLFRLGPQDVHVWELRLDLSPADHDRLERVISAEEARRADRFRIAADRRRYVAAHGLLRVVLSGYVGARPDGVAFGPGAGGKPRLAGRETPRFNLSHAGALGLVAVAADREVGIDIEEVGEDGDLEGLAETCFSPVERAALAAVPAAQRPAAFFAGWTRKEAFLKAIGAGLARPLDSFDVTLTPGDTARLLRLEGVPGASRRYQLRTLRPAAGFVAALAVDGRGVTIRHKSWRLLASLLKEAVAPRFEAGSGSHPEVEESEP
jgi:4'-phosphopantetheinyl transferase